MASRDDRKVVFRRIRGRLVPIRVKKGQEALKRKKQLKKGAIQAVGGGAGLVFSGTLLGAFFKKQIESKGLFDFGRTGAKSVRPSGKAGQFTFSDASTIRQFKAAEKAGRRRARTFKRFGKGAKIVGFGIAGTILGKGIENIIESQTGKQFTETQEISTQIIAPAIFGLGAAVSTRNLNIFKRGKKLSQLALRLARRR